MALIETRDARVLWKLVRGVLCIYKPAGVNCYTIRKTLLENITSELSSLDCRPPEKRVVIEGEDTTKELTVKVDTNYADHPLVVGPRYLPCDMKCIWATFLGRNTSGVQLYGLKDGTNLVRKLHGLHPIRTYRIKGEFGFSTDTLFVGGKVVEKAKYHRINRAMIDRWCATIQASHQTKMFEQCGVNIQSQEAYELAVKGLVRPTKSDLPVVYGVKCVEFKPPEFTIEVQCINEYEAYLMTLIHQIGYKLHSAATCTQIQCIRHTVFTLEDALLRKHWTLEHVIENLRHCKNVLQKHEDALKAPILSNVDDVINDYDGKELQSINR